MNEEEILKELFQKVSISFPHEEMEEIILEKIKKRAYRNKQKRTFAIIGSIGLGCFLCLAILFTLALGNTSSSSIGQEVYVYLGMPLVLIFLMIQLEILLRKRIINHPSI